MAQGKTKVKASLPSGAKRKGSHAHKKSGPKRGARVIAPKKTKAVEAKRLKKILEKAIKTDIEQEISMKAKSLEPKNFHLVKSVPPVGSSDPKNSKTNKK